MHAGRNFGLLEAIIWTRRDIYKYAALAVAITLLYELFDLKWLAVPWLPMALIGTAVAFLIGFKNNATYDRLWEARKIWGGIVNASRTWGIMVRDFINNRHAAMALSEKELKAVHTRLVYRHIAWLTALRHQLRQPRPWEYMTKSYNVEYKRFFQVPEEQVSLEDDLQGFISDSEKQVVLGKKNRATQLISEQSRDLKQLLDQGLIEDFRHMEMENLLKEFYTLQGQCERIKNFPYPRQFATLNVYFVWLFLILLPFGMISEFEKLGAHFIWLTVPFSVMVSWVFHTMEKIGESTENPFQGGANDVPITNLSRTIEIDLREMLDETEIPKPIEPMNNILM
ncbi:MAG TPA: bestrophin family ion channel [Saprospiraceae bacterium]|nr:bestrophin family ion channel [Saprospiraceae bacterium]HMQ82931.1 bestrophin family ion channel [Saprospiraceae bacterium]